MIGLPIGPGGVLPAASGPARARRLERAVVDPRVRSELMRDEDRLEAANRTIAQLTGRPIAEIRKARSGLRVTGQAGRGLESPTAPPAPVAVSHVERERIRRGMKYRDKKENR